MRLRSLLLGLVFSANPFGERASVAAPAATVWRKVRRSMGWRIIGEGRKCKGVVALSVKGWATRPTFTLFRLDGWPIQARFWLEWGCSHITDLVPQTN